MKKTQAGALALLLFLGVFVPHLGANVLFSTSITEDFDVNALAYANPAYVGGKVYVFADPDLLESSHEATFSGDPTSICVNVFNDYDSDGTDDGAADPPISSVTVTAYDAFNAATPLTVQPDGSYAFTPGNTNIYRIEVTGLPTGMEPSAAGATTVSFASQGQTVNVGLHYPDEFYSDDIFLVVPCYVEGSAAPGSTNASGDVLVIVPENSLTPGPGTVNPTEFYVADHDEIGATFGVAYNRASNSIFAAAFAKRHTGFGPSGTGAIYRVDLNGDEPTAPISGVGVSTIVDLNALFGPTTAGTNPHPNSPATDFDRDPLAYDAVGKVGLGGLAHVSTTNTLWTINLADRRLYEIPLGGTPANPTSPSMAAISTWPAGGDLTDLPGLPGTAASRDTDIRPFAVKQYRGKIYIGLVSTAESTVVFNAANSTVSNTGDRAEMEGFIYEFDPATDAFTQLLSFPLNYPREQAIDFCSNNALAEFNPWSPVYDATTFSSVTMATEGGTIPERAYPQPWITDIEFTEDGRMVIGIRDRFADQHGYNQLPPNPLAANDPNTMFTADGAGDVLLASLNTMDNTTFVLESNSTNGVNGSPFGPTLGQGQGEGPGGGEFFFDDRYRPANAPPDNQFEPGCALDVNDMDPPLQGNVREQGHDETSLGGIFNHNGQLNLITSVYDPLDDWNLPFNNAGIISLSNASGVRTGGNQVYATPTDPGTFAKGNGLGDVEGVAGSAPLQVGNRLWVDTDGDGLQDADEDGLNGVLVELYKDDGMGLFFKVAETTTAANAAQGNGIYIFSSSPNQNWSFSAEDEVLPNMNYEIRVNLATAQGVNAMITDFSPQNNGGDATNNNVADISDSDISSMGVIAFTSGNAGENNHGLDAGFQLAPPCAEKRLDWDVENWPAGSTEEEYLIGLTTVNVSIQASEDFATYERAVPSSGGFDFIPTPTPDDNDSLNAAGAMVGDGEALDMRLVQDGNLTIDLEFGDPVGSLMFSVLDLDAMESVTVIAEKDGMAVGATLEKANAGGPINVVGSTATATGGNSDNDNNGTVDLSFADSVDMVTLTFSNTVRVALSDLKICSEGMSLGNLVWNDIDNDGLVDVIGEPGIPGVALKLFKDEDSDGRPDDNDPVASTMTDGTGHYLFDDLNGGKYLVWIDTINFELNAVLDSFSTSLYTELDPEDAADNNDNGLNTFRKSAPVNGIYSGTVMLIPDDEPLMGDEPDQGVMGSGNATDENSDLTVDFGVLKDSDFDGAQNDKEGYGDRDGDGVANAYDFDPAGYVYCQLTGEIVKGGTIELVGSPPGGDAFFEFDGSSGFYQFFINSVPGTYTVAYTPPPGYSLSSDVDRQPSMGSVAGAFDPTPGSPDNLPGDDPVVLGEGDIDGGTVQLSDFSAASNPYYLSFDLNPDPNNPDPFVFNNNIPLSCACELDIEDVTVVCENNDDFAVTVDVSWVNEDPENGDIEITLGGQTVTIDPGTDMVGTATSPVINITEPGFGEVLEVEFLNSGGCTSSTLVDLVASCTPSCDDNPETAIIGGQSWIDLNTDGIIDPDEEGQSNVQVLIYECDNDVPVDTVYTNANGEWSSGMLTGGPFRVEFNTSLAPWLEGSFAGPDNGSNIQFAEIGDCDLNYGLINPSEFCREDLNVAVPCFVSGDPLGGGDAQDADWVVAVPYPPSMNEGLNDYLEDGSPVGSTWGAAFQKQTNTLYFSAFMKRHSGFGTLGTGGIYAIDVTDPANPVTSEFLNMDTDLNIETGTDTRIGDPLPTDKNTPSSDAEAFDLVGKQSLGDIDVSEDGQTMWAMNLFDRTLYELPIGSPAQVPAASAVTAHVVPDPGCLGGQFRPFAVKAKRGLVYIGGVCTGEDNPTGPEALKAYVFAHDPEGADGNFTEVLSFDLDYERGEITPNFQANWRPWIDEWTDINNPAPDQATFGQTIYPQPILSDIEFTDDGSMLLGFTDRFGHQSGNNQLSTVPGDNEVYEGVSAGDLLKACIVDGVYQIENNGSCGGITTTGAGTNSGPGGGEFFWQDMYPLSNNPNAGTHTEIVVGGLAYSPGSDEVGVPVYDPLSDFRAGGLIWMDVNDGSRSRSYEIFGRDAGGRPATFGKAGVFGDMEVYCSTPLPIQVGNYAWIDEDGDGIQDACEPPVPNLPVSIYDEDGNLIASTTTDSDGEYYFSSQSADDPNLVWVGTGADTTLQPNMDYTIVFGTDGAGNDVFDPIEDVLVIGDSIYTVTVAMTGEGPNPEQNDSDVTPGTVATATGFPSVTFNTGNTIVNHDLDAGFEPVCPFVELVMDPPSLCGADSLSLSQLVDSINEPDVFTYEWTTSGSGDFFDASGMVDASYDNATVYLPSPEDRASGEVSLQLSALPASAPSSCPPATDTILITILQVDCGSFPWSGDD